MSLNCLIKEFLISLGVFFWLPKNQLMDATRLCSQQSQSNAQFYRGASQLYITLFSLHRQGIMG